MQEVSVTEHVRQFLMVSGSIGVMLLCVSLIAALKGGFSQVFWRGVKFVSALCAMASTILFLANFEKGIKAVEIYKFNKSEKHSFETFEAFFSVSRKVLCSDSRPIQHNVATCAAIDILIHEIKEYENQPDRTINIPPFMLEKIPAPIKMYIDNFVSRHNRRVRDLKGDFLDVGAQWYFIAMYSAVFLLIISVSGAVGEALFQFRTSVADSKKPKKQQKMPKLTRRRLLRMLRTQNRNKSA